jgi:hypothetical protein
MIGVFQIGQRRVFMQDQSGRPATASGTFRIGGDLDENAAAAELVPGQDEFEALDRGSF